jgi:hypothetical protein
MHWYVLLFKRAKETVGGNIMKEENFTGNSRT